MSDNTTASLWQQRLGASRRAILQDALNTANGSVTQAAAQLGVNRTDMYRLLDEATIEYTAARAADGPAQMAAKVLAEYGHWLRSHADDWQEPDRMVTKWLREQAANLANRGETEAERRRNHKTAFRLCSGRTHAAVAASLRRLLKAERKAAQAAKGDA
jgi:Bacterial regulatory protein, Fis family